MLTVAPTDLLTTTSHKLFMNPLQSQSKRKAASEADQNPLLNAAKRTKKDAKNASGKNMLLANAEATSSGLFIVRESSLSQIPSSGREASSSLKPSSSLPLKRNSASSLRAPPAKKARAESQPPLDGSSSTLTSKPPPTQPTPAGQHRSGSLPPTTNGRLTAQQKSALRIPPITEENDDQIEDDVRAMDAEADHLRRSSRVYVPDSSTSTSTPGISFSSDKSSRLKGRGGHPSIVDTIQPLPSDESLQIERNKRLREGAMNAIAAANGDAAHAESSRRGREREREQSTVNGHRRKRSISGRGKRISTSFEVTGVIPQPHNSVSDTSFFKHIDADLPDSERLRTLFIWCASRAAGKHASSSKSTSTSAANTKDNRDKDKPPPDLPPLSTRAQQILKTVQDDAIRMLAERKIDLSLYGDDQGESGQDKNEKTLKPNEQSVMNRILEVRYAEQVKRAQEEEEAWKRVSYHYDAYVKRQKDILGKRRARLMPKDSHPSSSQTGDDIRPTTPPSSKAKGKQRDTGAGDTWWDVQEHLLPEDLQQGARIARALLAPTWTKPPSQAESQKSPASVPQKRPKRGNHTPLPLPSLSAAESDLLGTLLDEELESRIQDVPFKLDCLLASATAVRSIVYLAEEMNNRWFALLNQNLASRVNIQLGESSTGASSGSGSASNSTPAAPSSSSASSDSSSVGSILNKYAPRRLTPGPAGFIIESRSAGDMKEGSSTTATATTRVPRLPATSAGVEPRDLLRALSLVDRTRPPSQVGDAARRAAREVQRVGESGGMGIVGEKRITGINAATNVLLNTPRKAPATPRRSGDRTPRRERTPGRDR